MGNSEVSIIIPAWKADKWINDCLQSIYDQSWFKDKNNKWETLVGIDNCEETKSATLPKENTKLYYFKEHCGPYIIRNTLALKCAKYDNLIFFDSDDLMHPDLVKDCFNLDKDFITFQLGVFKNKSKQSRGSSFVKKSILSKFGGYDNWICAADNDFIKRIQANNIIWSKLTGQNYMYRRVHENQLTQRSDTGMRSELRKSFHLKTANKLKNKDLINSTVFGKFEEIKSPSINQNIVIHSDQYKDLINELLLSNIKIDNKNKLGKLDYMVCSFATIDKIYLNYAKRLRKQLEDLKCEYDIEYLFPPKKNSYKNWKYYNIGYIIAQKQIICLQKPTIILEKLLKYKKPILYVDIDCLIHKLPIINTNDFDMGYIYRSSYRKNISPINYIPYIDGAHLYNYTKGAINFLKLWKYLCDNPDLSYYGDHRRFWLTINMLQNDKNYKLINITKNFQDIFQDVITGVKREIYA
jgi:hypothetical protein